MSIAVIKENMEKYGEEFTKASTELMQIKEAIKKLKADMVAAQTKVDTFNGAKQAFNMAHDLLKAAEPKAAQQVEVIDGASCAVAE